MAELELRRERRKRRMSFATRMGQRDRFHGIKAKCFPTADNVDSVRVSRRVLEARGIEQ